MLIDENSSPMLKSAYEHGKEEGIKEGLEKAAVIVENTRSATGHERNLSQVELCAEAIRKEIK